MSEDMDVAVKPVQDFWKTEACGTHFIEDYESEVEFFEKYREYRYKTEWHIPLVVPFEDGKDKKVLEIGCGNGVDGVMWAKAGANYTGVDLTDTAVEATKTHFEILGLKGQFQQENAQNLSFEDKSFGVVYSHGVLHHTPEPQKAFDEVFRVLEPGGRMVLMLYHKNSFNYHVRIMTYMRGRVLLKILCRMHRWGRDRKALGDEKVKGVRGNATSDLWQIHYENFLRKGWSYLKADNFVHHCADGPECPYAFAYSKKDVRKAMKKFENLSTRVTHFPLNRYPLLSKLPFGVEKFLAARMGWYLFVYASKPKK